MRLNLNLVTDNVGWCKTCLWTWRIPHESCSGGASRWLRVWTLVWLETVHVVCICVCVIVSYLRSDISAERARRGETRVGLGGECARIPENLQS